MNLFRRSRPEPKRIPLADQATAFVGNVDLARSQNIDALHAYRKALADSIERRNAANARDTSAIETIDAQLEREALARTPDEVAVDAVADDALVELSDFRVAAE